MNDSEFKYVQGGEGKSILNNVAGRLQLTGASCNVDDVGIYENKAHVQDLTREDKRKSLDKQRKLFDAIKTMYDKQQLAESKVIENFINKREQQEVSALQPIYSFDQHSILFNITPHKHIYIPHEVHHVPIARKILEKLEIKCKHQQACRYRELFPMVSECGPVMQSAAVTKAITMLREQAVLVDCKQQLKWLDCIAELLNITDNDATVVKNPNVNDLCICCFNLQNAMYTHNATLLHNRNYPQSPMSKPVQLYGIIGTQPTTVSKEHTSNQFANRINISPHNILATFPTIDFAQYQAWYDESATTVFGVNVYRMMMKITDSQTVTDLRGGVAADAK